MLLGLKNKTIKGAIRNCGRIGLFMALAFVIAACSSVNHKVGSVLNLDTDLKLELTADGDINPDEKNKPSPVFIRLYELKTTAAFNKADFIDLYESDEEVLADALIAKQELKSSNTRHSENGSACFKQRNAVRRVVCRVLSLQRFKSKSYFSCNGQQRSA